MTLLILPRRFIPILSYILFSYILILSLAPLFSHTPSYILQSLLPLVFHAIHCYTYSLIWKGYNYAAADFYTFYITILIYIAALIFTAALISTVVLLYHF